MSRVHLSPTFQARVNQQKKKVDQGIAALSQFKAGTWYASKSSPPAEIGQAVPRPTSQSEAGSSRQLDPDIDPILDALELE